MAQPLDGDTMTISQPVAAPWTKWFGTEDGFRAFDNEVRTLLRMSGLDFLQRLERGDFRDVFDQPDHADLHYLIMQIPFEP
jgi:hypothetical protein